MQMKRIKEHIPINILPSGNTERIMFLRKPFDGPPEFDAVRNAHRDGGFTFIVQESGSTSIEIDFETYCIAAPAIIVIHPNQVHRLISFDQALVSTWIIAEENLHSAYLPILHKIAPAVPLTINTAVLDLLIANAKLCLQLTERKEEKLYPLILKDLCNSLVGLVISEYLTTDEPQRTPNRYTIIANAFKTELEKSFKSIKDAGKYADRLNISTAYLNECIKNVSGRSVSAEIQQRIILEAKRLLYHSSNSIKEIAAELGYDDFSYFTRLFVKISGVTPKQFREQNRV